MTDDAHHTMTDEDQLQLQYMYLKYTIVSVLPVTTSSYPDQTKQLKHIYIHRSLIYSY